MFTFRHLIWLAICVVMVTASVIYASKKKMTLTEVLTVACVISVLSEVVKVFSLTRMVYSADGTIVRPYIEMNNLPLHLCSLQILLIFYVRFTENRKLREQILAFMYPSSILGAFFALLLPSIFTNNISIEQAFTHPQAYQFFIYHSMLIFLGIMIARSDEIKWDKKYIKSSLIILYVLSFISFYLNSMFAAPVYAGGVLQSVEFWPNFMFTYNNPIGIRVTELWQWYLYLLILLILSSSLVTLLFLPLINKQKNK